MGARDAFPIPLRSFIYASMKLCMYAYVGITIWYRFPVGADLSLAPAPRRGKNKRNVNPTKGDIIKMYWTYSCLSQANCVLVVQTPD